MGLRSLSMFNRNEAIKRIAFGRCACADCSGHLTDPARSKGGWGFCRDCGCAWQVATLMAMHTRRRCARRPVTLAPASSRGLARLALRRAPAPQALPPAPTAAPRSPATASPGFPSVLLLLLNEVAELLKRARHSMQVDQHGSVASRQLLCGPRLDAAPR